MIHDRAIRDDWHVVYRSRDLEEGAMRPVRPLGEDLVLQPPGVAGPGRDPMPTR